LIFFELPADSAACLALEFTYLKVRSNLCGSHGLLVEFKS